MRRVLARGSALGLLGALVYGGGCAALTGLDAPTYTDDADAEPDAVGGDGGGDRSTPRPVDPDATSADGRVEASPDAPSVRDASRDAYVVFVSNRPYPVVGSPEGFDQVCRASAVGAGFPAETRWTAWVSSAIRPAGMRLKASGPWTLVNGVVVFADRAAFARGPAVPIDLDPSGLRVEDASVWTGTAPDGQAAPPDCDGFASFSADAATVGAASRTDIAWTQSGFARCDGELRLYCLQDD